jgi:predicted nucleotidyltransferase
MIREKIIEFFGRKTDVSLVILFGSQARNQGTAASDVDVAILSKKIFTVDEIVDLQLELSSFLKKEVDLVDLSNSHGAILDEVIGRGDFLINRHPELYEKLLKRCWYEREDDSRFAQKTYKERLSLCLK